MHMILVDDTTYAWAEELAQVINGVKYQKDSTS